MTIHDTKPFDPKWEDASVLVSDEHKYLDTIVQLTNELALDWNGGSPSSCISTSHALHYVLRELGYPASLVRVTTAVFPDARGSCGAVLGSDQRSSAASPGMWSGHLCCAVGFDWLLDATLDQANKPEWGDAKVRPLAIPVHSTFFEGKTIFLRLPGVRFRYSIFARQNGWRSAPESRPSHWRPLAERILLELPMSWKFIQKSVVNELLAIANEKPRRNQ